MILICEECGKKYQTQGTLKSDKVRFKCRSCSHVITITKKDILSSHGDETKASDFQSVMLADAEEKIHSSNGLDVDLDGLALGTDEAKTAGNLPQSPSSANPKGTAKRSGVGLGVKMMLLFLVIPVVLFAAAGFFYLIQMSKFSDTFTNETTQVVDKIAKDNIKMVARVIADECKQYILAHPDLTPEKFMADPYFSKMAAKRIGLTGYAALHQTGPFIAWAHPNRRIIGKPLLPILKKPLGNSYNQFFNIVSEVERGENVESSGNYTWQDPDGTLREKFMAVTPIEGTNLGISVTVYMEEFVRPLRKVERKADQITKVTRNMTIVALGVTLVLMAIIVFFYAHRITSRIRNLTELAERISVGEMDAEIKIDTKDEIGALGEAISRMQNSIRMSIERLRKRR